MKSFRRTGTALIVLGVLTFVLGYVTVLPQWHQVQEKDCWFAGEMLADEAGNFNIDQAVTMEMVPFPLGYYSCTFVRYDGSTISEARGWWVSPAALYGGMLGVLVGVVLLTVRPRPKTKGQPSDVISP